METKCSLPCSQYPTTDPYPEQGETSTYHSIWCRIAQSVYGLATEWTVGVRFLEGTTDYFLIHSVQTGSCAHPTSYRMNTRDLSVRVKRLGREADHSPPSSAYVKNGEAIPTLSNTPSWRSV
jgi:hypothetical protein